MSRSSDGQTGTSLGGLDLSPERRKREEQRRRKQEKAWAAKASPVTVRFDPSRIKPPAQ
jgi:hypothetical protein